MIDEVSPSGGTVETRQEAEKTPADVVTYWLAQEKLAEKELAPWRKRGRKVVRRYRDERNQNIRSQGKYNVLWANVQVLKPVLYARTPKPDIAPRWIDTEESVVRLAANILERSLFYLCDRYDIDSVLRSCVEDRLLPGMGVARVLYKPTFGEPIPDPDAEEPKEGEAAKTYQPVESEEVCWEYTFWEDVAWGPCRRWEEAPWLRFRSYMTRDALVKRFGAKIGKAVTLDYTPKGLDKDDAPEDIFKKAIVDEYWDYGAKKVVWIAPAYKDGPLDEKDDPLGLDGFWPCPKPIFATTTNDKMVPVPDFAQYQDQADELDTITARIDKLVRALRVAGVYAASEKAALQRLMQDGEDNLLIPVEDWPQFMGQKGGLEGTIVWLPIDVIVKVLIELYNARDRAKQTLYEITGLSDIMRGATEASETATAQQLKSQYGTIRVQDSQKDVARFARDLFRLAGQVIGKHLQPDTVSKITGLPELPQPVNPPGPPPMSPALLGAPSPAGSPSIGPAAGGTLGAPLAASPQPAPSGPPSPPQPLTAAPTGPGMAQPGAGATQPASGATPPVNPDAMAAYQKQAADYAQYQAEVQRKTAEFQSACELLRNDALRCYRIDIEADSTIAPDEQAEKQARVDFTQAFGTLVQQSAPLVQAMPKEGGRLVAEFLRFVAHGFRAGRPLVETIDKFADALEDLPPPPPVTDPALIKVQKDAEIAQQKVQSENAVQMARVNADAQIQQAKMQGEAANEARRIDSEHNLQTLKLNNLAAHQERETALKAQAAKDGVMVSLAKVHADAEVGKHAANLKHQQELDDLHSRHALKIGETALSAGLEREKFGASHALEEDKAAKAHDLKRAQMAQESEETAA